MNQSDVDFYRDPIQENICYDDLVQEQPYNTGRLGEMAELMVEAVRSKKKHLISGEMFQILSADCQECLLLVLRLFNERPGKTAADRLYAELDCLGCGGFARESILLMTADGGDYSQAVTWYRTYERNLGWKNCGEVLGKGKTEAAYKLGASL